MTKKNILAFMLFFMVGTVASFAERSPEFMKGSDELLRKPYGYYDLQRNTVSNLEFSITNTGKMFFDEEKMRGTGIWPRGSVNYYIYGGGIWVGGKKHNYYKDANGNKVDTVITVQYEVWDHANPKLNTNGDTIGYETKTVIEYDTVYKRNSEKPDYTIMSVTYNPANGASVMVPGRIEDGQGTNTSDVGKYRLFFSIDYNVADGTPLDDESGTDIWPIWDSNNEKTATGEYENVLKYDRYFGKYIYNAEARNTAVYPKGPAFISGEDIFSTYKDTDLTRYNLVLSQGPVQLKNNGYPLGIQYEQMVYSWGFGDYKDFIFVKYEQQNPITNDTLWNVWLAPVLDVDIAFVNNPRDGASNDRCSFYGMENLQYPTPPDPEKAKKNFAYQWSDGDKGEQGRGFGYVAFVFLESPAIIKDSLDIVTVKDDRTGNYKQDTLRITLDSTNFVRRDSAFYAHESQLGLVTYRNWSSSDDKKTDIDMYEHIASAITEGDTGPGDKRYMMATGPFNLRPGDTARTVVGMVLTGTGKGVDADGTDEDLTELVRKVDFAQKVYDDNFRAPQPPWRVNIAEWKPLNNGMVIKWDNFSESSDDPDELGLDFMGYKIYRARRSNLDTFSIDDISPSSQYPAGQGPFGWKLLKEYSISTPYYKRAGNELGVTADIDSIMVIGPIAVADSFDLNAVQIMRIPRGFNMYHPLTLANAFSNLDSAKKYYPKLGNSGFLTDTKYGSRILPVVNSIDTAKHYNMPWSAFYDKMAKEDGIDFSTEVLYYQGQHNYLIDSLLVGVVYLNQSLAKINPLFYTSKTVPITSERYEQLRTDTTNKGEVWIIDTIQTDTITVYQKIKIDTLYMMDTYDTVYSSNNSSYTIRAMVPLPKEEMLRSLEHTQLVTDSIYSYISKQWIREYSWPDFAGSSRAKNEIIQPYMYELTNGRTFVDIGDDNGDAQITTNPDIGKTEQIFNNVEYYYKVLSFDEGDYTKPTPVKINEGLPGLPNFTETYPAAERVGNDLKFDIISADSAKLGGLYNFNLFAIEPQRASQLFTGDTIEIEFKSVPFQTPFNVSQSHQIQTGLYIVNMVMRNVSENNEVLFDGNITGDISNYLTLTPQNCKNTLKDLYTEYTLSRTADTLVAYSSFTNDSLTAFYSFFTTGDFQVEKYCYASGFTPEAYGTIGLSFNSAVTQYGGVYRPWKTEKLNTQAGTMLNILPAEETILNDTVDNKAILMTRMVGREFTYKGFSEGKPRNYSYTIEEDRGAIDLSVSTPIYGRFNNGPGIYEVEFLPGDEEDLNLQWGSGSSAKTKTFKAKYLIPKITNVVSFKRPSPERNDVDSIDVVYNTNMSHLELPVQPHIIPVIVNGFQYLKLSTPSPLNMLSDVNYTHKPEEMMTSFNLYSQAYVGARDVNPNVGRQTFARDKNLINKYGSETVDFVGTQGRYYTTVIDGTDTLDFVHTFNIAGAQFIADYLGKARRDEYVTYSKAVTADSIKNYTYGADFVAGDKIRFSTFGGALGFPFDGAKVKFAVSQTKPKEYTDGQLDGIKVVPNPYVITHQGQKSPYDAKIYFTKLPEKCTITIYTAAGDVVKVLDYNEALIADSKYGVDIWDLLTSNGQRVESQTLVALIQTPDGAMTTRKFSIVVGGFRIID